MSSEQQDLPDTTLLRGGMGLGRLAERQLAADWDHELAIAHRFSHELERSPVEFREHERHLYRWVLRGVLRCCQDRGKSSPRFDVGDQLFGGSSADSIRNRIERGKIRN